MIGAPLVRVVRAAAPPLLVTVFIVAAVNALLFSYATAIPLVQSDAWTFLDGYVRTYLEGGFGWEDFFIQAYSSDTNLPLHKLVMLFNINHFAMDFKVEGLVGVASAVLLSLLLVATCAGFRPLQWRMQAYVLLAWVGLVVLTLNSSNVYTWPLATMWFLNILLVCAYFAVMVQDRLTPLATVGATLAIGALLDEVAIIAAVAAAIGVGITRDTRSLRVRAILAGSALGATIVARALYAAFDLAHGMGTEPVQTPGLLASLGGMVSEYGVQLVLVPLANSVIHYHARQDWFPGTATGVANALGFMVLAAHVVFWVVVARGSADAPVPALHARRLAVALMLFFYGMVAGIALQRIAVFGIEYLHQPRYVVFYSLNLVALGLMAYSVAASSFSNPDSTRTRVHMAGAMVLVALMACLQWNLSERSWKEARYLSSYVRGAAATMGRLAADPASVKECADILTVCNHPPNKRAELLGLLVNYQLNLFDPAFQEFYRLDPYPPVPASTAASSDAQSPAPAPGPADQG